MTCCRRATSYVRFFRDTTRIQLWYAGVPWQAVRDQVAADCCWKGGGGGAGYAWVARTWIPS
eukprot:163817-Chlamydomonas_euryale.AAC.5